MHRSSPPPIRRIAPPHRAGARRKRRARSQDGAVMLVVLLILLVATASAAVSVSNTQTELQAAGNERVAMQTRYVAEAAITTTVAWMERLSNAGKFTETFQAWQGTPPTMEHYAEPEINVLTAHSASRTLMDAQMAAQQNPTLEVFPLSDAAPPPSGGTGGGGGGGGTGGSAGGSSPDLTGSFGPKQGYGLPPGGYVVDITDCHEAVGALTAGSLVAGGGGSSFKSKAFHCTVTARGRLEPIGSAVEREWTLGARTVKQGVYSSAHDARAEIITPEMILPAE